MVLILVGDEHRVVLDRDLLRFHFLRLVQQWYGRVVARSPPKVCGPAVGRGDVKLLVGQGDVGKHALCDPLLSLDCGIFRLQIVEGYLVFFLFLFWRFGFLSFFVLR